MMSDPESRYELKLVVEGHYLARVRAWLFLNPGVFCFAYPSRTVNTLYLDTPSLDSLRANLAGLSQRRKLRLRW